jgi:hypothetical protein
MVALYHHSEIRTVLRQRLGCTFTWHSAFLLVAASVLVAESGPGAALGGDVAPAAQGDQALIVAGLAGDDEHEALFRATTQAWKDWLIGPLQFPSGNVRVLFGERGEASLGYGPATREAIAKAAAEIRRTLHPDGRLWVLILGHTNQSAGHLFLHLPGADLRDDELGALFKGLSCRQQVFWVTTAGSGWFLPALSAKGRIVITATERGQEFNETEFPHALADLAQRDPMKLDRDGDGKISIWELFVATGEAVEARFAADSRAPTEHAQLDDNGDQNGTERPLQNEKDGTGAQGSSKQTVKDGELAKKTFLPPNKRKKGS